MTKPDSQDTPEGLDLEAAIRHEAAGEIKDAIHADVFNPDSYATLRDQTRNTGDGTAQEAGQDQTAHAGQQTTGYIPVASAGGAPAGNDSHAPTRDKTRHTPQTITCDGEGNVDYGPFTPPQDTGDIPLSPPLGPPASSGSPPAREEPLSATFKRRMEREGLWREVSKVRDRMMVESKAAIPDKDERREWVAGEMNRMYPPPRPEREIRTYGDKTDIISEILDVSPLIPTKPISVDSGAIQGLSDLPEGWPELPANASLSSEVGWVQANRLRIVEERPGGATRVRLERALSPAPSWAALGWLETSIRSYAKYVDVASKASTGAEDEGAVMKRERKSVDEVRALLDEMKAAEGTCPHCGRPH